MKDYPLYQILNNLNKEESLKIPNISNPLNPLKVVKKDYRIGFNYQGKPHEIVFGEPIDFPLLNEQPQPASNPVYFLEWENAGFLIYCGILGSRLVLIRLYQREQRFFIYPNLPNVKLECFDGANYLRLVSREYQTIGLIPISSALSKIESEYCLYFDNPCRLVCIRQERGIEVYNGTTLSNLKSGAI